jgi:hypothetical protein
MKKILEYYSDNYYTMVIARIIALVGFFFLRKTVNKELSIFSPYLIVYFLGQFFYSLGVGVFQGTQYYTISFNIILIEDYLFTIFEFLIFFTYLRTVLRDFVGDKILKALAISYLIIAIGIFFEGFLAHKTLNIGTMRTGFIVQALFLLSFCVAYFIKIFKSPPTLDLLNEPSFWISTGLSFCMLCTLPISLFLDNLMKSSYALYVHLFAIVYIFYCLLFLMIIRASLCKPLAK